MQGAIIQINLSKGGVPKLPIADASVTPLGIAGDLHAHPAIHGGPNKAILMNCCWSQWESLGHPPPDWKLLTELRVIRRRSRSLELFTLDNKGTLWTTYQQ